jgi:hypothetical protein
MRSIFRSSVITDCYVFRPEFTYVVFLTHG